MLGRRGLMQVVMARAGTFAALLLASACGGEADDGRDADELLNAAPIVVEPRAPLAAPVAPAQTEEAPERDGLPAEVASLVNDPPERVDAEQFNALLGYYCVNCHATPPYEQASDGFFFDDWAELAAGGNHGPSDAERMLERVAERLSGGDMPPESGLLTRPLPEALRPLMVDFIEATLNSGLASASPRDGTR